MFNYSFHWNQAFKALPQMLDGALVTLQIAILSMIIGMALAIATFDDPSGIAPTIQWGVEAKLPYVDGVAHLPGEDTMGDVSSAPYLAELVSYQHPDHDTDQWPPEERS